MSKRAEQAERKYFGNLYQSQTRLERDAFIKGYEQAEKDTIKRAIEWWRPRLCGFLKEGLTEGVLGEFRKEMEKDL